MTTQLAVIGAGPGGYTAAFYAADQGMEVTLIDPAKNPGGVCLYRGCIPSKALLHVAEVISEANHAKDWGISFSKPIIDLDKLRSWKNEVVEKLTGGVGQLSKQRKINYIQGSARFIDANTLEVEDVSKKKSRQSFGQVIIATGSSPAKVPGLSIDSPLVMDSTSALELNDIPESLLVIGGGYIGLEMGTVYATLGSKVTVIEMTDGLLPGVDRDLVNELARRLGNMFHEILLNTTVVELKEEKKGIKVAFKGEAGKKEQAFDKVLISVGRKPNTKNFGLENTKVLINEKGFIQVDGQRRTKEPAIFAIGDVVGEPMLAHKASHEAFVAVDAIAGKKTVFEPAAIPAVVFTDPEIAWCGLTETEAKRKNLDVEITKFPWRASGRAITLGRTDGLTKQIIERQTGRILGVGIAGPRAGELIAEGVLAVEMAALASDVHLSIHPHPTLSETIMEAAELFDGQSTHFMRARRK